jgi:hypothetical protein
VVTKNADFMTIYSAMKRDFGSQEHDLSTDGDFPD